MADVHNRWRSLLLACGVRGRQLLSPSRVQPKARFGSRYALALVCPCLLSLHLLFWRWTCERGGYGLSTLRCGASLLAVAALFFVSHCTRGGRIGWVPFLVTLCSLFRSGLCAVRGGDDGLDARDCVTSGRYWLLRW